MILDHGAGGGASPRGTKKSSKLELKGRGARGWRECEDVEGPYSALLPRERNSEGEKNEILCEHERLQVSIMR